MELKFSHIQHTKDAIQDSHTSFHLCQCVVFVSSCHGIYVLYIIRGIIKYTSSKSPLTPLNELIKYIKFTYMRTYINICNYTKKYSALPKIRRQKCTIEWTITLNNYKRKMNTMETN